MKVFIAEKPSVATEFAKALKLNTKKRDGYIESDDVIITWCVGHLVTMSYPDAYDEKYKKWNLADLPFIPEDAWKYEIIPGVKKQFGIVKTLLTRDDVDTIYVCTDSGREGEYIYRLVAQEAGVKDTEQKRVWIDSQTEEEILRGIKEAKDISEYNNLSDSAYLRAKEDYLMGINFSRLLTLKYGRSIQNFLKSDWKSINVGRVMTCVLGMICQRENEIRNFIKTPFYRVMAGANISDSEVNFEWKAKKGSNFFESPLLYKENGFKEKASAQALINGLETNQPLEMTVKSISIKDEKKQPPLLYNLAELQNDCSKMFKISPSDTLKCVQDLYEAKLCTYPRTDARVLTTAVAKVIDKNIKGLMSYGPCADFAKTIMNQKSYSGLEKTKYVDDKKVTDHYAIIPTGQGLGALARQSEINQKVYQVIVRRFLSIFYPPAIYKKAALVGTMPGTFTDIAEGNEKTNETKEQFNANFKVLVQKGYMEITGVPKKKGAKDNDEESYDEKFFEVLYNISKGDVLSVSGFTIKEGETTPPKRYTSGSLILAMENAGQLIEDEDLRAQIKGSGIGTSATRAEIIKKLTNIKYIQLNKKTQVVKPTQLGEMIYGVVHGSIKSLLNPELTANWEMGLEKVAEGELSADEYMKTMNEFIRNRTSAVMGINNTAQMTQYYRHVAQFYERGKK
ncbi:MAG: type IA DNA topoisomerase [Eubacterium sp.]|nr:type IA DNA topoisomerase [Eubacterium sp.]